MQKGTKNMKKRKQLTKITAGIIAAMMLTPAVHAYDFPGTFWSPNNAYEAAVDAKNAQDTIKYGEQVLGIIRNEPLNEQTADVMGSRLYEVGNAYERIGQYDNAARCFKEYIPYGEYRGWEDGVKIADAKALQFSSDVKVFTETTSPVKYYGAKNEPKYGTLVGQTSDSHMEDGESMILLYHEYGHSFDNWEDQIMEKARRNGQAVEFALNFPREGNQLDEIINDNSFMPSVTGFLKKYSDVPVYVRIGAEANIWGAAPDADKFKQAFRKIADEIHRGTNNAATVWSMGHTSSWYMNMDNLYPGDEYVDWVGISAYCNKYFEAKRWDGEDTFNEVYFKSGDSADPVLLIKHFIDTYGDRKPIMLAECGLSYHTNGSINETHTDWAVSEMERMYNYIPMVYPQVKLIAYFNKHMDSEKNYYDLSGNSGLLSKYKEVIKLPHFIQNKYENTPQFTYKSVDNASVSGSSFTVYAYPHVFGNSQPKVDYYIDGKWAGGSQNIPYKCELNLSGLSDGTHELKAVVESNGSVAAEKKYTINTSANPIKIKINGSYANSDVPPFIDNSRTYVPVRVISENLGCDVQWEQSTKTAVVTRGNTEIRMTIGSNTIKVNGADREIDAAVQMKNDRTFLPIRAIGEILGAKVDWDNDNRCVIVEESDVSSTTTPLANYNNTSNKLVMGTNAAFPPFEFCTSQGLVDEFDGIDVAISQRIAKSIGKSLEIVDMEFDKLITSASAGEVDFVAAAIPANDEKRQYVDFSDTYFTASQVMLVASDNDDIKTAQDLKNDKRVGVAFGYMGDNCVTDDLNLPEKNIKRANSSIDIIQDVKNGKLDAAVVYSVIGNQLAERYGLKVVEDPGTFETEEYAIAVKKGNTQLLNEINRVIREMKESGEINALAEKYT